MKKLISYYFVLLEIILFAFIQIEKSNIYFNGILYHAGMILFLGISIFISLKFNNILRFKKIFYITLIFYLLVLNNIYMFLLSILLFIEIMILNRKDKFILCVFSSISIGTLVLFPIIGLILMFRMDYIGVNGNRIRKMVYEDYYYKCDKYEIFYYSGGAMDRFHYAVMEKHKYMEIKNLLEIGYDEQVGDTLEEYNAMKESKKCNKVNK